MLTVNLDAETSQQGEFAERLLKSAREVELTILMPCLNEAETLGTCIAKATAFLRLNGVVGEIVIADNGSTDGSQAIARKLGARVVPVERRGYGAAILGGIAKARGKYTIMGDADDSYDFANLGPFLEALRDGAALVMGNRFEGGVEAGAMPWLHRYVGNPVLSLLGRLFFKIPVGDFHCGLRGFSTQAIRDLGLVTTGMEFASEMVVRSALEGYRIAEAPTTLKPDGRSRAPHLKTWRDGWRHLKFLLTYSPRWLFLYPGAVLTAVGSALSGALAFGSLSLPGGAVLDINTFTAACFMVIAGVQLISFGVLARYYAGITGVLPEHKLSNWLNRSISTDNVARAAGVLLLAGLSLFGSAVYHWARIDFGDLTGPGTPRALIAGLSLTVIGIQMGFQAFMVGVLEIPLARRTA